VIAGASVGLGAAFADAAAGHGFNVVLIARRQEALAVTAAAIEARRHVETRRLVVDLADPAAGQAIADATADIDVGVLVYNAAAEPEGLFLAPPLAGYRTNLEVNCWTPTVLCHLLGPRLQAKGRGAVAIVSSMAALQGIPMFTAYGAAKAYELILAEGLWHEWRAHGVDVLGYVVGATASSTFRGAAPDAYDGVAGSNPGAQRILQPASPEAVAARLFERLHLGPRQYSHDDDEIKASADAGLPRAEVVDAIGRVTSRLARFQSR
jgi:short-subunit dehydrogenase